MVTTIAHALEALSAVLLWIPAYQASLIKLAQSELRNPQSATGLGPIKRWLHARLTKRDRQWTERHHVLLIVGFALMVLSSVLKFFFD